MFVAGDNAIVREGVKAMLSREADFELVGEASDYDGLVSEADGAAPHVLVTDIRMPPNFQREGTDAAQLLRKRHPGVGVVIVSQYDDPEYALSAAEIWTISGSTLDRMASDPHRGQTRIQLGTAEESVIAAAGVSGGAWMKIWLPTLTEGKTDYLFRVAPIRSRW